MAEALTHHGATQLPQWTLGDHLRKARDWAGIKTAAEMAMRLTVELDRQVKPATVTSWERDAHQPNNFVDVLHAWAKICQVPDDYLIDALRLRIERFASLSLVPSWTGQTTWLDNDEHPLDVWGRETPELVGV